MRLIDADALEDVIINIPEVCNDASWLKAAALSMIGDAPTLDAVPVVRCKDCKWWDCRTWDEKSEPLYGYCNACKHGHYSPNWEISISRKYKADWYCADGERRESE